MAQARLTEFYSTIKTTDHIPSKRRKVIIEENHSISSQESSKVIEIKRTRSIKTRSCKTIKPAVILSRKTRNANIKQDQKVKYTEIKDKRKENSDGELNKLFKYTSSDKESISLPTFTTDNHNSSPVQSPTKRHIHDNIITSKRSRKHEFGYPINQIDDSVKFDNNINITESLSNTFKVRRNLFSSVEKTKKKTSLVLIEPTLPKDNIAEVELSPSLSFIPIKSPTKSIKGKYDTKTQETTPVKTPQKSAPTSELLSTPIKEMSTMERLNSPVKVDHSKAGQSSVNTSQIVDKETMRARLAGCKKLTQLKDRLAAFSGKFKSQQKSVKPTSPMKSQSTIQSSPLKAHEKFKDLATSTPKPSLTLPFKYRLLDNMFKGVDTILSMMDKRSELCTFPKLKAAVELMVKRTFATNNLGQMKTVYPSAYQFRQEKGLMSNGVKNHGYQLTIEPLLHANDDLGKDEERLKFTATDLIVRRNHFHNQLIEIVKSHHKVFLSSLEHPLKISDDKLQRWHPGFPIEDSLDIVAASLPEPPYSAKPMTASEMLEQNRFKNPRIEKALRLAAAAKEAGLLKGVATPASPKVTGDKSISLIDKLPSRGVNDSPVKGVALTLLERIRQKESLKLQEKLCQTPDQVKKSEELSRLPDIIRIVRTFFINQKKAALPEEEVINSISSSYKTSLSLSESRKHLAVMVDLFPEWITEIHVSRGKFIKMNKNYEQCKILAKLSAIQKGGAKTKVSH